MLCKSCGKEQPEGQRFCASCGTEAGKPPKKKMSGCMLATIIGGAVLVVSVPILGIIAAIAIPNLLNAIDRGKQKRTMADIKWIANAVDNYRIDNGAYPVASSIDELKKLISPEFLTDPPMTDGWMHPIQVASTPEGYLLVSPGKDGVTAGCGGGAQQTFDADICFENGAFSQWPAGTQQ